MSRSVLRIILVFAALLCGVCTASSSFAADRAQQRVRIAAFNLYPGIFQAKDGNVQGFYVDIISEVAKREGWQVEYVYGDWADGISRIKKKEVDLLTSVAWTAERAEFLEYGKVPLLTVWGELYVPNGSRLNSIKEVEGKRVAVMKRDFNGASFSNMVEKFGITCQFVEYGNFEEIFSAVAAKTVDAGVVNNTFGAAKQSQYGLVSSGIIFNPFDIFLAVSKGKNGELLRTLDRYLGSWRATEGSPYHKALNRWSHGDAAALRVMPHWLAPVLAGLVAFLACAAVFIILLRLQVRRKTAELSRQAVDRQRIEETLFFINDCGARHRADELLYGINRYLGNCLDADYVFVAQLISEPGWARTHGFYARTGGGEDITYQLSGTPCENVLGKSLCVYPEGVTRLFPEDRILADLEVEGYAAVPLWDSQGQGIGLLGIMSRQPLQNTSLMETVLGIASSRVAQELEAMQHLQALNLKNFAIDNMKDAVYWIRPDGRIWEVNGAASKMLGYSKEEFLYMSTADLRPGLDFVGWQALWADLKEKGSLQFETSHRACDGRAIPVEVTANYISYNGSDYKCAIVRDIAERKRMEEALEHRLAVLTEKKHLEEQLRQSQKMEAIGHLAGGIAHDFNNILTVIVGYGNFLEMDGTLTLQQREQVDQIIAASEKGSQLTRGLLTFSRKQIMNPRILDLNALVNQVQKFLLRIIGEDIELQFAPHPRPMNVFGDGSQLEQILMNLATNARDAMPNGGVLTIETCWQDVDAAYARSQGYGNPGRYACLMVSDTGSGMDQETRERIFEPFFSTKVVGKGTGLGMSIVYGIVKQHKGFINVYSEQGDGTAFKIYLPEARTDAGTAQPAPVAAAPELGTETILVAEDDASVRKLVESLLIRYGYQVVLAVDGNDCVQKYQERREEIALILMDVIMPGKNGKEAFEEIKALDPGARVLYSSGYTADFMKNRGVFDETVDLVMKPVQPMALLKKVREVLDRGKTIEAD